jgi:hypothetical protein
VPGGLIVPPMMLPELLKTKVPGDDGVKVIVLVQVAPAGIVIPIITKLLPNEKEEFAHGLPTANCEVDFVPVGNDKLMRSLLEVVVPVFFNVTVKTVVPAGDTTVVLLNEVDIVTELVVGLVGVGVVVAVFEPPPQAAKVAAASSVSVN